MQFVEFLENNTTSDFQFIRPSGNPANLTLFKAMFSGADLVVTDHSLIKIQKLEVVGDMAFACMTESAVFEYKGTPNNDRYSTTAILRRVDGVWKFCWMHRSTGDQEETPEFDWSLATASA
mmetsp:Transcript_22760/g.40611  ORF Transcript_22760/g.40611 Transcript_22760/m.40611 type:complete len:121 (-) Transcript_22760:56-418(-)